MTEIEAKKLWEVLQQLDARLKSIVEKDEERDSVLEEHETKIEELRSGFSLLAQGIKDRIESSKRTLESRIDDLSDDVRRILRVLSEQGGRDQDLINRVARLEFKHVPAVVVEAEHKAETPEVDFSKGTRRRKIVAAIVLVLTAVAPIVGGLLKGCAEESVTTSHPGQ